MRDVTDAGIPGGELVHLRSLAGDVALIAAGEIPSELPHANRARVVVEVVFSNHVAVAEIRVASRAVLVEEDRLVARVQIDDAVVLAVAAVDVFLDDQVAAALVDLALVVVALRGHERRAGRMPVVERDAAKLLVGAAVLHGRGVHVIVVARVHLPDHAARAKQRLDVVDLARRVRHHVVAQHARPAVDIERRRLAGAEIPAFAGRPAQIVVGREQRSEVRRLTGALVVAEQRRPAAALAALETEEDQHRVAAGVVVDVAPVGIASRQDAVLAAAIAGIRQANPLRGIGRRERECPARRYERCDLARRQLRPEAGAGGRINETSCCGRLLRPDDVLRRAEDGECGAQERENPTGTQEHASSPQFGSRRRKTHFRRSRAVTVLGTCGNPRD